MKPIWVIIIILLTSAICLTVGYKTGLRKSLPNPVKTDTVIRVDTVHDSIPVPVEDVYIADIEIPVPVPVYVLDESGNKVEKTDTMQFRLPISKKTYENENYKAVVSGFNAKLEDLTIYKHTEYIRQKIPDRRWGLGVTAGYGVGKHGLSPYIGLGVYYRIY